MIGDSTPGALRRIANLLTNGPSPKESSEETDMQENNSTDNTYTLPTTPVELEASAAYAPPYPPSAGFAELEAKKNAIQETVNKDLPTTPVELWGSDVTVEMDRHPFKLPQIKLSSQDSVQRTDTSSFRGQERGKGARVQADEWLLSNRARKTRKPENWNYF